MYFKDNKNGKILNVLLGIIALFLIMFIIAWIMNKGSNSAKQEELFKTNLENVQATAKDYFATDLPKGIGDSKVITLGEMYDLELTDKLSYSKTDCDEDLSYMSVTKINAEEYKVKTNLVCGDKTDSLAEKIKATTVVKDQDGNVVTDKDNNKTVEKDQNTTKDTTKNDTVISNDDTVITSSDGKKADSCSSTSSITCRVYVQETSCTTDYEYEFKKSTATCPSGYVYSNNTCVKSSTSSVPATNTYTNESTKIVDAKINKGGSYKIYASPIITGGKTMTYCDKGTMGTDGYCYQYTDKKISTSSKCPTGYTKNGNYCYKYTGTATETTTSCDSGYTKSGNACYKYANMTTKTTSACPTGYTKDSNNKCYVKTNVTNTTKTSCPSGYTQSGNYCYKYANQTAGKTTCTCPSGYKASGNTCYKTTNASVKYTAWGNPTRTYTTTSYESPYTDTYEKKLLVSSKKQMGVTQYTYQVYNRSSYYSCSSGTQSGAYCYHYTNKSCTTSAATCPSGYTKDGSKCYMRQAVTKTTTSSCPSGYTKTNNACYKYANMTTTTNVCPTGYTKSGNTCYIKKDLIITTTTKCPAGYTRDGNQCYIRAEIKHDTVKYCPEGYVDGGDKCYIKNAPKSNTSALVYKCPAGYTTEGTGANTKCSMVKYNTDTYYCENANATLIGKKCYIKVPGQSSKTCPAGYTLNGDMCYSTSTDTTSPIYSDEETIYSKETSVPGYYPTGRAKFVTSCTPTNVIYK